MGGLEGEPRVVLVFPDGSLDPERSAADAQVAARGGQIAGMTASGEISAAGPLDGGCTAMAFSTAVQAGIGVTDKASEDPRAAGRRAAERALRGLDTTGHPLLILLLDTRSGDQSEVLAGAYEAAGPRIPLIGGAAGGADPAQLAKGTAGCDRVVAVAIVSPSPVGVGIAHGCSPVGVPSIVTRARDRVVLQLDGRDAEEVFLEKLGMAGADLDDSGFEQLATVHPLGQPELRGDVRLRHVLGRADGGGLACATHIPANAAVDFTEQPPEAIVRSGFDAVSDSLLPLGDSPPRAALVFDCAGRRGALGGPGPALDDEVAAIVRSYGPEPPQLAGLYTRGEIGRVRGAKGDRNHAIVVATFG